MHFPTAGGPFFRHLRIWHAVLASLVVVAVVAVVAYLALVPSDDVRSVPNSPCRPADSAREDTPATPDLDGDGHTDLAVFRYSVEDQELVVLEGPFKRSGAPARTVEIPSPDHEAAEPVLVAGDANDDRADDLALYGSPWDPPLLFTGGARTVGGLNKEPERLPEGENIVFGDFDGDGRQDIAMGRSFIDGYDDVDTPHRRGQVSVRYGKEPGEWVTMEGGDFKEGFGTRLAVGDFNGDGRAELTLFGGADGGSPMVRPATRHPSRTSPASTKVRRPRGWLQACRVGR
ncbi:FG-GAP repeat domain-containing protein [Streptomyces sp. NPDC055239]